MINEMGQIGVLMGGYSSERDISLKSGRAVVKALKEQGALACEIDIVTRDDQSIKEQIKASGIDVAFIALHGILGEDGRIQEILESLEIAYTGSGVEASRIALDKIKTKEKFAAYNIPIPKHVLLKKGDGCGEISFPVVVKPVNEGSSIGISIVKNKSGMQAALESVFQYGDIALAERFIEGRELTVGILGEQALPIIEIKPKNHFYDYTAKYEKGLTEFVVPAKLDGGIQKKIQDLALQAHQALGCCDLSRVDLIIDKDENLYFLEVNTIPGFTATSLVPMAAKEIGVSFNQLCIQLVELAYGKKNTAK